MFEIAITWIDVFSWAVYAISSFGLSKFFKKFNVEGWWAPGFPARALTGLRAAQTEKRDGKAALIMELIFFPFYLFGSTFSVDPNVQAVIALVTLFLELARLIYKARITIDLCGDLKVNRAWAILWVFAEVIPCLVWGFSDKYSPKSGGAALQRK